MPEVCDSYNVVLSNANLELIFRILEGTITFSCITNSNPKVVVSIIEYMNNILCDYLASFDFFLQSLNVAERINCDYKYLHFVKAKQEICMTYCFYA